MILAEGLNFLSTQLRGGKDRFGGKRIQENHYFLSTSYKMTKEVNKHNYKTWTSGHVSVKEF